MAKAIVELMNIHSELERLIKEAEVDFIGEEITEGYISGLDRAKEIVEECLWSLQEKYNNK